MMCALWVHDVHLAVGWWCVCARARARACLYGEHCALWVWLLICGPVRL